MTQTNVEAIAETIVAYCKDGDQSTPKKEIVDWVGKLITESLSHRSEEEDFKESDVELDPSKNPLVKVILDNAKPHQHHSEIHEEIGRIKQEIDPAKQRPYLDDFNRGVFQGKLDLCYHLQSFPSKREDKLLEAIGIAIQYVPLESKNPDEQKEIDDIHRLVKEATDRQQKGIDR